MEHPVLSRRSFVQRALAGAAAWPFRDLFQKPAKGAPETLYNGIVLPSPWPPRLRFASTEPLPPPYIVEPPEIIPIDVGRQLFVDDFLIEETTLSRTCHTAHYHPANPILKPETSWEMQDEYAGRTRTPPSPSAMVFSDGVFFDPADRRFKMWYMGGYLMSTCYAVSPDGVAWQRPKLDVRPNTNIVITDHRDSSTIWLDQFDPDPTRRYKATIWDDHHLELFLSADGIHWRHVGRSGTAGDRSTFFYNPFRKVWVYSLRDAEAGSSVSDRFRRYREGANFEATAAWRDSDPVAWVKADRADFARPESGGRPELYNLDCVAYESVLLGLFTIWRGETKQREKINEVAAGFSRDGFHFSRPDRRALVPVSDRPGSWNFANVQSAGGCCLIVGDQLYFYVSARAGIPGTNFPGVCSTGLAILRRDGFASMDWLPNTAAARRLSGRVARPGELITRPIRFNGRHLFVNVDAAGGSLKAEVLDRMGRVIQPYTLDASVPVQTDTTRARLTWTARDDLSDLAGETVRFRFALTTGRLYAFWVSPWPSGESRGYVAAGGPEFRGPIDERHIPLRDSVTSRLQREPRDASG